MANIVYDGYIRAEGAETNAFIRDYLKKQVHSAVKYRTAALPNDPALVAMALSQEDTIKNELCEKIESIRQIRPGSEIIFNLSPCVQPINIVKINAKEGGIEIRFENNTGDFAEPLHFHEYRQILQQAEDEGYTVQGKGRLEKDTAEFTGRHSREYVAQNMGYYPEDLRRELLDLLWPPPKPPASVEVEINIYADMPRRKPNIVKRRFSTHKLSTNYCEEACIFEHAKKNPKYLEYIMKQELLFTAEEKAAIKSGLPPLKILQAWYERRQIEGFNNCHSAEYRRNPNKPIEVLLANSGAI